QLVPGVVDACPRPIEPRQVSLRHAKTDALLGVAVPAADQVKPLTSLGLELLDGRNEASTFRIPTWRVDLKREIDLVEEVARLYGVERIPSTPPRGAIGSNPFDSVYDQIAEARRLLSGLGLNEATGQTLIAARAAGLVVPVEQVVLLANPLSGDLN